MRVVGGKAKGRRLKGAVIPGVRPTTERARSAIFNILSPHQYQGKRVADLYAGTGSLGIEALSRDAAWVDFVERNRRQCAVIHANLETTGLSQWAAVHCMDVEQALAALPGDYQLVLMDPPYRLEALGQVLTKMSATEGLLARGCMVVLGHSRHLDLLADYGSLHLVSHRRYGDNVVDFFQKETGDGDRPLPGDF